jgi:hypothetical protein
MKKQDWINCLNRKTDEGISKNILQYEPKGCRGQGRPWKTWKKYEKSDKHKNIIYCHLQRLKKTTMWISGTVCRQTEKSV